MPQRAGSRCRDGSSERVRSVNTLGVWRAEIGHSERSNCVAFRTARCCRQVIVLIVCGPPENRPRVAFRDSFVAQRRWPLPISMQLQGLSPLYRRSRKLRESQLLALSQLTYAFKWPSQTGSDAAYLSGRQSFAPMKASARLASSMLPPKQRDSDTSGEEGYHSSCQPVLSLSVTFAERCGGGLSDAWPWLSEALVKRISAPPQHCHLT